MSRSAASPKPTRELMRSQKEFLQAREPVRQLVRQVLMEEREVAHMRVRKYIHQSILDHVKQMIP